MDILSQNMHSRSHRHMFALVLQTVLSIAKKTIVLNVQLTVTDGTELPTDSATTVHLSALTTYAVLVLYHTPTGVGLVND